MVRKSRPWSAYLLRILCSSLMFVTSYALLAGSTFALRLREDIPIQLIVVALGATLSYLPLLAGRKYLGALLVSAFLISGIGGYWWTTIPWDEFVKDSGFPTPQPPDVLDYALVASPAMVAAFYAVASRPSLLRADLKNRGADLDEIRRASAASFLAGSTLLVVCVALAGALWLLMASGLPFAAVAPIPVGIPALVLVAALASVAWAILARRLPRFRPARQALPKPKLVADAPAAERSLLARIASRSKREA